MSWRDRLRPAFFRGVRFFVDSHDYEVGRRVEQHEFPQREKPIVEDLGRAANRIRITGYLVGPNYMRERDRLLEACGTRHSRSVADPSGRLTHPYLGTMRVVCASCRMRESFDEGGMARFLLTFRDSGDPVEPFEAVPELQVDSAADGVENASGAAAMDAISTKGPQSVRDATTDAVTSLGDALQDAQALFEGVENKAAEFAFGVQALVAQASALSTAPAELVARVRELVDDVLATAGAAGDALFVYETLFGVDPVQTSSGSSPAAKAADENAAAIAALARRLAVAGSVRAAAEVPWESLDAAEAARDRLAAQLDVEQESAPDTVYAALASLRASLVAAVPPASQSLPRQRELILSTDEPALVVAWRLYGDAARGDEIATRNRAAHPGFLPGGERLQVLSS
ncbi:MAG: DNA circularization N-terminal domain-containing protein [Planctomycetota bacterium]